MKRRQISEAIQLIAEAKALRDFLDADLDPTQGCNVRCGNYSVFIALSGVRAAVQQRWEKVEADLCAMGLQE